MLQLIYNVTWKYRHRQAEAFTDATWRRVAITIGITATLTAFLFQLARIIVYVFLVYITGLSPCSEFESAVICSLPYLKYLPPIDLGSILLSSSILFIAMFIFLLCNGCFFGYLLASWFPTKHRAASKDWLGFTQLFLMARGLVLMFAIPILELINRLTHPMAYGEVHLTVENGILTYLIILIFLTLLYSYYVLYRSIRVVIPQHQGIRSHFGLLILLTETISICALIIIFFTYIVQIRWAYYS